MSVYASYMAPYLTTFWSIPYIAFGDIEKFVCHPPLPLYAHSLLLAAQHGYLWLEGNILFFSYIQLQYLNGYSQMSVQELFIWIMHCSILLYYMNIWIMNNLDVPQMLWTSTKLLFPHQIMPSLA